MSEKNLSAAAAKNGDKIRRLEEQSGVALHECYQCGKCSAGCPMAENMDITPRQVLRYLQLGLLDEALNSKAPWKCATCHTCSARCPHNVEISEMMEAVRQMADREGIRPVRTVDVFTRTFMLPVKLFGRSHEMTMTAFYNLLSGRLLQNFEYVPGMLSGGKLKILPEGVKDKGAVKRLIDNCAKEESGT